MRYVPIRMGGVEWMGWQVRISFLLVPYPLSHPFEFASVRLTATSRKARTLLRTGAGSVMINSIGSKTVGSTSIIGNNNNPPITTTTDVVEQGHGNE
jgi:hypothetical protein